MLDTLRNAKDESTLLVLIDAEARKLGERIGFVTLVVLTVNDDYWVSDFSGN